MTGSYVHQTSAGAFVPAHFQKRTRAEIARHFPEAPIDEIESAAHWFYLERDRQRSEPQPSKLRSTLDEFDADLSRMLGAFDRLREQRLDSLVKQDIEHGDAFEVAVKSLRRLRLANRRAARGILPGKARILASRMLVQRLAVIVERLGLPLTVGTNDPLPVLVGIIFSDDGFKDSANARSVTREWEKQRQK